MFMLIVSAQCVASILAIHKDQQSLVLEDFLLISVHFTCLPRSQMVQQNNVLSFHWETFQSMMMPRPSVAKMSKRLLLLAELSGWKGWCHLFSCQVNCEDL